MSSFTSACLALPSRTAASLSCQSSSKTVGSPIPPVNRLALMVRKFHREPSLIHPWQEQTFPLAIAALLRHRYSSSSCLPPCSSLHTPGSQRRKPPCHCEWSFEDHRFWVRPHSRSEPGRKQTVDLLRNGLIHVTRNPPWQRIRSPDRHIFSRCHFL